LKQAYEINNYADAFNDLAGTTRAIAFSCSVVRDTNECLKGEI
jgi:hypothetical protein